MFARSIRDLRAVQVALRDALEQAEHYGDRSIWAGIATALGSVRAEIGRLEGSQRQSDAPAAPSSTAWQANGAPSIAELADLILAALVSAEALGRDNTALILNDALISVTGKGISPEGWPQA
ncbi:MAG: hypothetical protein ACO1O3_06595 [Sphingobium sp.]